MLERHRSNAASLIVSHSSREIALHQGRSSAKDRDGKYPGDKEMRTDELVTVQVHWIDIENVPAIWERLEAVGLHSTEACGDSPRPFLGSPVEGPVRRFVLGRGRIRRQRRRLRQHLR